MKKKWMNMLFLVVAAGMMTGCGASMPELTEEQYDLVAEYAAGQLMKYNKLNEGRIVSDTAIEEQLAREEQFQRNTQEYLDKVKQKEKADQEDQDGEASEKESGRRPEGAEEAVSADIASFIGLGPVTVSYTGMEVCASYPQSSMEDSYFALDAEAGKKLVVLKFVLSNPSGADQEVDVLESGTGFWVSLNGGGAVSIQATMLTNDLATYKGTVPAEASEEVVLVLEPEEAETEGINSISLIMKNENGTAKTLLQ